LAFPPRAVASSAMRGKRRRRARASHVCLRSTAYSRQVRARAQQEEAAIGTLRSVGICEASKLRITGTGGGRTGQWRTCLRRGGGRSSPPQGPPAPPRSTSAPGTLTPPPTVRGRPGTPAGCGPAASCRAGRSLRTGGPSGGGRPGTACSTIRSVRRPRGARTVAWDRTTCQSGGRRRVPGAATAGSLAATACHQGSPPRWGPIPWARPWGHALLGFRRRGLHGWVRVRLHRSLRGASRGCLPRGVRRMHLGWRGWTEVLVAGPPPPGVLPLGTTIVCMIYKVLITAHLPISNDGKNVAKICE